MAQETNQAQVDEMGNFLKQLASEGKISPQLAGLSGETVMPAAPVNRETKGMPGMVMPASPSEEEPEQEPVNLPGMIKPMEEAKVEDIKAPKTKYRFSDRFPLIAELPNVTENLADAVQYVESGNKWDEVNPTSGAIGLMQIVPEYAHKPGYGARGVFEIAESLGYDTSNIPRTVEGNRELLFKPDVNRIYGEEYLKAMYNYYDKDLTTALIAYNKGPDNANKWLKSGGKWEDLYPETKRYLEKINRRLSGEDFYGVAQR